MYFSRKKHDFLNTLFVDIVEEKTFFFLSGFSFTDIHNSRDSRRSGGLSLLLLSTTPTRFTDAWILAGPLLQGTQPSIELAAGLEPGTFGFHVQVANH